MSKTPRRRRGTYGDIMDAALVGAGAAYELSKGRSRSLSRTPARAFKRARGSSSTRRWVGRSASRSGDTPGGRGYIRGSARGGTSRFRRRINKLNGFRSFPNINETFIDSHVSFSHKLQASLDATGGNATDDSLHFCIFPVRINDIEPYFIPDEFFTSPLTFGRLAGPVDQYARGYPVNQLLQYYNNYVVKGAELKVDVRVVDRNPGGAAITEDQAWYQSGQVTVPVNITLIRVKEEELHYICNQLPEILKENNSQVDFNTPQLFNYDRVMREQFGSIPLTLHPGRREGVVGTKWNAAVANETSPSSIVEKLSDSYSHADNTLTPPTNGSIGVTETASVNIGSTGAKIVHHPDDKHYVVMVAWINPSVLRDYFVGGPNDRDVQLVFDVHLRQQVAFGDVVSIKAGISSGTEIITRNAVTPLLLKRSVN